MLRDARSPGGACAKPKPESARLWQGSQSPSGKHPVQRAAEMQGLPQAAVIVCNGGDVLI